MINIEFNRSFFEFSKKPVRPSFFNVKMHFMSTFSRKSFRLLLTRHYVASFFCLILLLGVVTCLSLYQNLLQSLDRSLLLIAQSEADFATQNADLHLHRTHDVLPGSSAYSLPRYVQITTLKGQLRASNHGFRESPFTLTLDRLPSHASFQVLTQNDLHRQPYRILYLAIEHKKQKYSLQVATPLAPIDETLLQVMGLFGIASVAILILASFWGWRIAGRAVAPLAQIAAITAQIDLKQLSQRIPDTPQAPQELYELTTQLNAMLARLEQAASELRAFTANASHELRTPLTILKGEIQVALRKPRENQAYKTLLLSNLEEVNRLIQLAEVLLNFNRIEQASEMGTLLEGHTALEPLLEKTRLRWLEKAHEKGIGLIHIAKGQQHSVAVHTRYLEQILDNLLENALRFSPVGSQIQLDVIELPHLLGFSVTDQGPGISAADQGRIFERFFQVEQARTENRQHFGMGLALSKTLAESHGGQILLASEMGQGCCFKVLFPLSA